MQITVVFFSPPTISKLSPTPTFCWSCAVASSLSENIYERFVLHDEMRTVDPPLAEVWCGYGAVSGNIQVKLSYFSVTFFPTLSHFHLPLIFSDHNQVSLLHVLTCKDVENSSSSPYRQRKEWSRHMFVWVCEWWLVPCDLITLDSF